MVIAAIIEMLHFNSSVRTSDSNINEETSAWKVLILDSASQQILSPILKVNDLREHGVTLYLQLHGERQAIPDVPAVYFVEPTAENISRISQDLKSNLYESVYLNFTSAIPRALLEDLAYNSVESNSSAYIAKVTDQYLNYITLESNLFTLGMGDTFAVLNDAKSSDQVIEGRMEKVAAALFSVLLSVGGQPPLIYASKGTAAEALSEKVDTKIRNYLLNNKTMYLGAGDVSGGIEDSLQRPLLLLLDRTFDLATMLRHTSTYNALVHDILGLKLNRVTIASNSDTKVYDIDGKDTFWSENSALPFPTVAEHVDAALTKYKADMLQVTRNGAITNFEDLNANAFMSADELKMAIKVLPELTERKRIIDSHLQISTALLEQIKTRNLGDLFHLEQGLSEEGKGKVLEGIRAKGSTPADKMRLFLVYYFTHDDDISVFESALKEAGCDMSVLPFCQKIKSLQRMISSRSLASSPSTSNLTSTGNQATDFLQSFGKISGGVLGNMFSTVKNLLPESFDTPLTKIVDAALQSALGMSAGAASTIRSTLTGVPSTPKEDLFTITDPKTSSKSTTKAKPATAPQRSAFNHLIVFIVGGSNYTEYNHVQELLLKRQLKMDVSFGSTDLLAGEEFLHQLSQLAQI